MLYVTGDTHNERLRFTFEKAAVNMLKAGDKLIVAGDFGFVFWDNEEERAFRQELAKKPYEILFVDGNHENHVLLNSFPVEIWNGGKVHVIARDEKGTPKVIHLMRGQVFTIDGKKIFTFGGGFSIDRIYRKEGVSWWLQEMPSDEEFKEANNNLEANDYAVDYIVTHTAPEETMSLFHPKHSDEKPLNNFLEWICEKVKYRHWWFGHLHKDLDLPRNQTVLWYEVREMENNEVLNWTGEE